MRRWALLALLALGPGVCAHEPQGVSIIPKPPPGSNEVMRHRVEIVAGLEVIIADVVIAPHAEVPPHYHPGEEFLYVLEGEAIHVEEGKAEFVTRAGDAYVIPPMAPHAPRGGPEGARAIVFRLHLADQPERIPVEQVNALPADD